MVYSKLDIATLGISIATNAIDYTIGGHSDKGIVSNEFLASTMVDFGVAGLTGLAAAGLVAGAISFALLLGVAAVATAPISLAIAATAVVGLIMGLFIDNWQIGGRYATDILKEKIADGMSSWGGTAENVETISKELGQRTQEAVKDKIEQTIKAASEVAYEVKESVSIAWEETRNEVINASEGIKDLFGRLFGND